MAPTLAPEHAAPPGPMVPVPYRVAEKRAETADTVTLELEPEGEALPRFGPGQFAMLYAFGAGEVPISVSGKLGGDGRLEHTVRSVGAVSRAIGAAKRGAVLGVRGPFGTTWPVEEAAGGDLLIVAGGIGMAPLRPVVLEVMERRERFGRVTLLDGGRSPEELLYPDELQEWRGHIDMDVEVTVDSAPEAWRGRVGVVTKLVPRAEFDPETSTAMICGPEIMMRFTIAALRDRGVPPERIWISMERSMKCAIGHCGHCQIGPAFVCKDGAVFRLDRIEPLLAVREL